MPRNYPASPDFRSSAEKRAWEALQALPDDVVIFANVPVIHGRGELEADFVVAWPHIGLAVLEVKGGQVWVDEDGRWFSTDRGGHNHSIKHPYRQAREAGYALAELAANRGVKWPDWTAMAVLPDTNLPAGFCTTDTESDEWVDGPQLKDLPARLRNAAINGRSAEFDGPAAERLVALLEIDLPRPPEWRLAEAAARKADLLTRDQYAVLRAVRNNNRIIVDGGPGSGKTWLAMQHARTMAARGARVGLICFNRALAQEMAAQAATWPADEQPAHLGTIHELARLWTGREVPSPLPPGFFDDLVQELRLAAERRDPEQRFDVLIVDEAQDIDQSWWPGLEALLSDPTDGQLVVFRDSEQELYGRTPPPIVGTEVTLDENVRNTAEVVGLLDLITDRELEPRRGHGPSPMFIESSDPLAAADEVVAQLLGLPEWRPQDIALLTTHHRHPRHKARQEEVAASGFTLPLIPHDDVAYSTVKSFKGLERPVVVLAVNGFHRDADPASELRVGLSRATHRLIVVGAAQTLREAVGDDFIAALTREGSTG